MATVAEFVIPADEFPLGHAFEALPDVSIEMERVVPTNSVILPYFWVRGVSVDRIREELAAHGELESFAIADELETQALVRADWDPAVEGVLTGIVESDLTLRAATGTGNEWRFEFRADDEAQLATFQQYCSDQNVEFELVRLHDVGERDEPGQYKLTAEQREALLLAHRTGYYEIPRRSDQEELAGELDITHQSLSDRLRRGHKNLIANTLRN